MLSSLVHPLKLALLEKDPGESEDGTLYMEENRKEIWERFYEKHSRSFWLYIYKICGNEQTADDIFQESFYKFLKAGSRMQNEKHMQAYIYRIAYRLILDRFRRAKVERKAFEEGRHTFRSAGRKEGPESQVHFSLDMEKTFKGLKPKERMILWLAHVEGYSYREIAEITDTKVSSLKVQLFRAREKLARTLRRHELQRGTLS
jgi:RNA polymerase sigma-70 factor (ECF subfamily)